VPLSAVESRMRRLPVSGLTFFALLLAMVVAWGGWRS
jgi:hypothetical protein